MGYQVFSATADEAVEGWIWQKLYPQRTIVTISRTTTRQRLKIFCVVRQFDTNFIPRYNKGASAPKKPHRRGQRYKIIDPPNSVVMNEWYRQHCLGIPAHGMGQHPCTSPIELDIVEAKRRWHLPATWFPGVRAACHQPDIVVRLSTRLGVLGGWLGVIGLLSGLIGLAHPYWPDETVVPGAKNLVELVVIAVMALAAVLLGAVSIWICMPPRRAVCAPDAPGKR